MSNHISYIIETNGENGVGIEYRSISYVPTEFTIVNTLPDPDDADSPEYVGVLNGGDYDYYRRVITIPPISASLIISILIDGSESNGDFIYDYFTSFFSVVKEGTFLSVLCVANKYSNTREGDIIINSNQYDESLTIHFVQDYTPIQILLQSYAFEGIGGYETGDINEQDFDKTFHWLTSKDSPDYEKCVVTVLASGQTNDFIIRSIAKFAYAGLLDSRYAYHSNDGKYYEILQTCVEGEFKTIQREVVYDTETEGVYKQTEYQNDLNITKEKNTVTIINYGRCFLEDDAYYVITLSNIDDISKTSTITIRYVNEAS